MKTRSFAPAEQSGAGSLQLERVVLDGRDEADWAWIDTLSRFDDAVKVVISGPPTRNERLRFGAVVASILFIC